MSEENENKTEEPTPRRREKAREEGQVAFSSELNAGVVLFILACICKVSGGQWVESIAQIWVNNLSGLYYQEWSQAHTVLSMQTLSSQLLLLLGGFAFITWSISLLVSVAQIGVEFHTKPLIADISRISPTKGWNKIFSSESAIKGILSILKLMAILSVMTAFIYTSHVSIIRETRGHTRHSLATLGDQATNLLFVLGSMGLLISGGEYLFRRHTTEQKLKMAPQEIKQEAKEDNGDQQIKSHMRRVQNEARQRRNLSKVPEATIVITNPTHFAVALRYDSTTSGAPVVVAKGVDTFAKRIIRKAKEHGVPVQENRPLARALYAFAAVGEPIPMEFYQAIAEVLAQLYRTKKAA